MTDVDLVNLVVNQGFATAVAVFLLWKGYTQDKEYLKVLQDLSTLMREHISQKDAALDMLKKYER